MLFGKESTVLGGFLIANNWQWIGYWMLIYLAALQSIPGDLYEAAKVDGASALRQFLRITLPMLAPAMTICIVGITTGSLKVYDLLVSSTNGGPGRASTSIIYYTYSTAITGRQYGYGSALTISVVAALLIRAIGKQLVCVHVNHGLMRKGESEQVVEVFRNQLGANLIYVDAVDRFLTRLEGVSDPEQKRKVIGAEFIRVFEEEARKLEGIEFLAQGTIYPDIVESAGVKAHHNVGGLPDDLKFDLVEPLRLLFKDEVRQVGAALALPDTMVYRQPFPGPGLGVRCLGAITRDRLAALRESDAILREEFDRAGLTSKVWQFFTIVPDMRSTGVRDGARVFDWPVIIRAVNTVDAMTATVPELPWALLKRVTDRVLSEVPGVCRVLYDLSPKPVGTIEWE